MTPDAHRPSAGTEDREDQAANQIDPHCTAHAAADVCADQHAAHVLERRWVRISLQTIAADLSAIADRLDQADGGAL